MTAVKIGVLVSGSSRGTNFQAILDAIGRKELHAKVALLVSTGELNGAVARARDAHVKTLVLPPDTTESPEDWDHRVADALYQEGVAFLCLAGYGRFVSHVLLEAFPRRILNVHPALLPAFGGKGMYGNKIHRAVIEQGCKVSGCTVHFVDERYDTGPIIAQACVKVEDDDTPESLASRVQGQEHRLYPQCIEWVIKNELRIEGRRVRRVAVEEKA